MEENFMQKELRIGQKYDMKQKIYSIMGDYLSKSKYQPLTIEDVSSVLDECKLAIEPK